MNEKKRLLLVDDSVSYSEMVQSMLQLEGRYEVDWVTTLERMRQHLGTNQYAVILLDNHLPDGTGLDALPDLSARATMPPVIMITGEGDEVTASRAIKLGAYDYLRKGKPELIELSRIIDRVIRMHSEVLQKLEAEEKVRYHSLLLECLTDAVIVLDSMERVSYWNEGAVELFGVGREEASGSFIRELFPADTGFHKILDKGDDTRYLYLSVLPGQRVYVSVNAASIHVIDQDIPGRVYVFRDITRYRILQDQLRRAQMELLDAGRVESMGELASSLAHRIHNPLTTVLGEAQILVRELEAGSTEHVSAEAIEEAGWRASEVIKELMELTAVVDHDLQKVEIVSTILTAVELSHPALERQDVQLSLHLVPDLPKVSIHERDLIDLWFNLIQAAAAAARGTENASVYVETYLHDKDIEVKIRCSGTLPGHDMSTASQELYPEKSGMAIIESILLKYGEGVRVTFHPASESEVSVWIWPSTVGSRAASSGRD